MDDFDAYLEPEFAPRQFARDLIVGTNGADSDELELETSIKRLRFDIDECDKRMAAIAGENYQELVGNFEKMNVLEQIVTTKIDPAVAHVNTSFDRIQAEVLGPYDNAMATNGALKRVSTTVGLLRGVSVFIVLVQQLEDDSGKLSRQARLLSQLFQVVEDQDNLLQIRLVRNYQPLAQARRDDLIKSTTATITLDAQHVKQFTPTNDNLIDSIQALYLIDSNAFVDCIEKVITKQVTLALAQLQRALNSPRNFPEITNKIIEETLEFYRSLTEVLKKSDSEEDDINILQTVNISEEDFWPKLAFRFKKNVVATMARGGPIAKNLRSYYDGLVNTVEKNFDEKSSQLMADALQMIKQ